MKIPVSLCKPQRLATILLCSSLAVVALSGCNRGWDTEGGDSNKPTDPENPDTTVFQGPGSSWTLALEDKSDDFILERRQKPGDKDANLSIKGTYATSNTNDYFVLTVTDPGDSGLTANQKVYGIQAGKELTILKPFISGTDTPLFLVQSACPSDDKDTVWMNVKSPGSFNDSNHTQNHYGQSIHYKGAKGQVRLTAQYNLDNLLTKIDGKSIFDNEECSAGLMEQGQSRVYLAAGGSMVMELANSSDDLSSGTTTNTQFLLGLEQRDFAARDSFNADYVGFFVDTKLSSGAQNSGVKASCTAGLCNLTLFTDLDNETEGNTLTLDLSSDAPINAPKMGFLSGKLIDDSEHEATIMCSINVDYARSGNKFMACVGDSPGDENAEVHLFLVVH